MPMVVRNTRILPRVAALSGSFGSTSNLGEVVRVPAVHRRTDPGCPALRRLCTRASHRVHNPFGWLRAKEALDGASIPAGPEGVAEHRHRHERLALPPLVLQERPHRPQRRSPRRCTEAAGGLGAVQRRRVPGLLDRVHRAGFAQVHELLKHAAQDEPVDERLDRVRAAAPPQELVFARRRVHGQESAPLHCSELEMASTWKGLVALEVPQAQLQRQARQQDTSTSFGRGRRVRNWWS
eukprot:scaffold400_cov188-Pinguiococcus_pyrenoidosus.AAC.1